MILNNFYVVCAEHNNTPKYDGCRRRENEIFMNEKSLRVCSIVRVSCIGEAPSFFFSLFLASDSANNINISEERDDGARTETRC
jgi:hypothetical protein